MVASYIIHLPRSTERVPIVDALMARLPDPRIVDAVDGRLLSEAEREAACTRVRHEPRYPFLPLLPGEIGVFLSHRRCWQAIVARGDPFGVIAEDDLGLDALLSPRALALGLAQAGPDRLIRFPLKPRETAAEELARDGEIAVFRPKLPALGTTLQIVGRDLAARMLELTEPFDRPLDTLLQMRWITGADVLTVYPNGARSAVAGSTIQRPIALADKLRREWRRCRYRAQIARLARQDAPDGATTG